MFVALQSPTRHDRALRQLNRSQEARAGSIAPRSSALLSSWSSSLSVEYTELEGLCFLALLLLFSFVTLSISQTPLSSSYSDTTSVPLVMLHYVLPINDRNWKVRRGWDGGCF